MGDLPGLAELAEDLYEWHRGWEDQEPELNEEAVNQAGGYAYEYAYLIYRHPPPETLQGEDLEWWSKEGMGPQRIGALEHVLSPTDEEIHATLWAMELHGDRERHGSPYGGGHYDQPSGYLYVVECVQAAKERAERTNAALEALGREQERADAESPGEG